MTNSREVDLLRRSALILGVRADLMEIEAIEKKYGLRPARIETRGRVAKDGACNGTVDCGKLRAEPHMQ